MAQPTEHTPEAVSARTRRAGETPDRWSWVEPTVWTERPPDPAGHGPEARPPRRARRRSARGGCQRDHKLGSTCRRGAGRRKHLGSRPAGAVDRVPRAGRSLARRPAGGLPAPPLCRVDPGANRVAPGPPPAQGEPSVDRRDRAARRGSSKPRAIAPEPRSKMPTSEAGARTTKSSTSAAGSLRERQPSQARLPVPTPPAAGPRAG
jgi:hypothetical protein